MNLDEAMSEIRRSWRNEAPGMDRAALVEQVNRAFYTEAKFGVGTSLDQENVAAVVDAAATVRTESLRYLPQRYLPRPRQGGRD